MSFDYIYDLFGKIFKTSSKYKKIEKEAIELILTYYKGTITDKRFNTQMLELQARLYAANPNNEIGPGYPLWLSQFLGYAFHDWNQWYRLRLLHIDHPEKFDTPELEARYQQLEERRLDNLFREYCRRYLVELGALK